MKTLRRAFTLIEVLISVLIISVSIIFVLKLHSDNYDEVVYISKRNITAMEDSLFLSPSVLRYHKDKKDAYTLLLQNNFHVEVDESRKILKKTQREIFIPETTELVAPDQGRNYRPTIDEIFLKDAYSSHYFRLKL